MRNRSGIVVLGHVFPQVCPHVLGCSSNSPVTEKKENKRPSKKKTDSPFFLQAGECSVADFFIWRIEIGRDAFFGGWWLVKGGREEKEEEFGAGRGWEARRRPGDRLFRTVRTGQSVLFGLPTTASQPPVRASRVDSVQYVRIAVTNVVLPLTHPLPLPPTANATYDTHAPHCTAINARALLAPGAPYRLALRSTQFNLNRLCCSQF